ncbi:MAG: hypothetical protein K5920_07135 [Bacteroidales bacterium]|nr:hypothetical protein [Bacteroidales bacterium]
MPTLTLKSVSLQSRSLIEERYTMIADLDSKPYTVEEINAMIDQAERESAAGLGQDSEEMFRELEEEFALGEQ